jgi:hypothetical protein
MRRFHEIESIKHNKANYYYIKIDGKWEHGLLRRILGRDYLSFHPDYQSTNHGCIDIPLPFRTNRVPSYSILDY